MEEILSVDTAMRVMACMGFILGFLTCGISTLIEDVIRIYKERKEKKKNASSNPDIDSH